MDTPDTSFSVQADHDTAYDELAVARVEIERLKQELRAYEELRRRMLLAVGAAHDIGNVLAAVLGVAQLAQQVAPPTVRSDLDRIALAASDGAHLLRRVFAMRAPEAGPRPRIESLATMTQDALGALRYLWEGDERFSVCTQLAETPPVSGHPAEIRAVLMNLITNAVAAMPEGGTLTINVASTRSNVAVEVGDTGEGISPQRQEEIFRPFVSTHSVGRGMGLSVARAIVEEYGGTLTVRSTPRRGATFIVSLPRVDVPEGVVRTAPVKVRVPMLL